MVTSSNFQSALFGLLGIASLLQAEQSFPPAGWQPVPSPLASPQAEPGRKVPPSDLDAVPEEF